MKIILTYLLFLSGSVLSNEKFIDKNLFEQAVVVIRAKVLPEAAGSHYIANKIKLIK